MTLASEAASEANSVAPTPLAAMDNDTSPETPPPARPVPALTAVMSPPPAAVVCRVLSGKRMPSVPAVPPIVSAAVGVLVLMPTPPSARMRN